MKGTTFLRKLFKFQFGEIRFFDKIVYMDKIEKNGQNMQNMNKIENMNTNGQNMNKIQ